MLAVAFLGVGFAVHALWLAAIVFAVFWLAGFAFSQGRRRGERRRYRRDHW